MNIYELAISKATPEEAAKLLRDCCEETSRYREAFEAAKSFIESHVSDPDITAEMVEKFHAYQDASKRLDD